MRTFKFQKYCKWNFWEANEIDFWASVEELAWKGKVALHFVDAMATVIE